MKSYILLVKPLSITARMGGLIPLLLPSSTTNRASVATLLTEPKRPVSVMAPQNAPSLGHKRQQSLPLTKSMRRLTITTPTSTLFLPETSEDWRVVINDVKQKYVGRKYRTCSARCCDILDNIEDSSKIEILHLVYLHFYAASSFEMCARPLSQSSAYRTKLLNDAREHYDKASALIKMAEETAIQKSRSPSALSTPSLGSSRSSSVCTTRSSRNSISSIEELKEPIQPARPKKKKKVSFSGLPAIDIPQPNIQPEPLIRPDSPTLGWDQAEFVFGQSEATPDAVVATKPDPELIDAISPRTVDPGLKPVPEEHRLDDSFDMESFLHTKSVNRIITKLSALRSQVAWHRDNIDTLMTEPDEIPGVPETPTTAEMPSLPGLTDRGHSLSPTSRTAELASTPTPTTMLTQHTLECAFAQSPQHFSGDSPSHKLCLPLPAFGGHPDAWDRSRSGSVSSLTSSVLPPRAASSMSMRSGSGDEALQKRIDRLRANGWQRKRFDSRRYEALREQVLNELGT